MQISISKHMFLIYDTDRKPISTNNSFRNERVTASLYCDVWLVIHIIINVTPLY